LAKSFLFPTPSTLGSVLSTQRYVSTYTLATFVEGLIGVTMDHRLIAALKQVMGQKVIGTSVLTDKEVRDLKNKMKSIPRVLNSLEEGELSEHVENRGGKKVTVFEIAIRNFDYFDDYRNGESYEVIEIFENTIGKELAGKIKISSGPIDKGWFDIRVELPPSP